MVIPKHLWFHWAYFARIVIIAALGVELYKTLNYFSTPGACKSCTVKASR